MYCFWNSLLRALRALNLHPDVRTKEDMLKFLKSVNLDTPRVLVNGLQLTERQRYENRKHIYNCKIENGYYCSACDPVFVLFAHHFQVNVHHHQRGRVGSFSVDATHTYTFPGATKTCVFNSSTTHIDFHRIS